MCSISLPSNSVVVVGLFAVVVVVAVVEVVEIKPSGVVGALSVVGHVCASTSLGVVAFSSSIVGRGDVFAAIEVSGGFISV